MNKYKIINTNNKEVRDCKSQTTEQKYYNKMQELTRPYIGPRK